MGLIGVEFPQVLAAAQQGEEWAWTTLYHSLADRLGGYVRAKNALEPDDLVGEVFCDLARNITNFEGTEASFRSWAFGVAHNRLVDQWRKSSRRHRQHLPVVSHTEAAEVTALNDHFHGPALAAVALLTDDQQAVMLLRVVADLSIDDTAAILKKRPNAIKALQHRAVKQLRKNLECAVTK